MRIIYAQAAADYITIVLSAVTLFFTGRKYLNVTVYLSGDSGWTDAVSIYAEKGAEDGRRIWKSEKVQ